MDEQPDFQALAKLWLARDPRAQEMDDESRAKIVSRLAEALKRRRQATNHSEQDVGLVVNVDRDSILPGKGLAEEAIEQLTKFLQERIDDQNGV
jgi:hypothetical protein